MQKKIKKTKEERTAEEYFPVDETDLKHATEKQEKESMLTPETIRGSIEKKYQNPERTSLEIVERRKIKNKRKNKNRKYEIPKINLKPGGYELVITEKPQAASKIASALGESKQKFLNKVSYYEVDRNGEKIIVACAVGHLLTLIQNIPNSHVPMFDVSWAPNYIARKKDFTKRYFDTILSLAKNAGSLTVATDFDIEGEVIGMNVIKFICGQKDANRMKFSTLTESELNQAYEKKLPSINFPQAIAGETRHYLDWFYGINLSRALMNAIKTTGNFKLMSIGRVQGPTLNLIVQKEKEIQEFKSEPYWQIFITVDDGKNKLKLKHNKDIFDKSELKKFENLEFQEVKLQTTKTKQVLPPNTPFNLTSLQIEAYKFYGITPSRTLQTAQSLYLAGLISYPRTSSQKLPNSIGYQSILKKLAREYNVEKLIIKQKPLEGKKSDPAHPSIYPTGNTQILSGDEEKIYNLVVRRFLSLFCDNAIIDKKRISTKINSLLFSADGSSIRKKAWMEIYPSKLKENEIPDMQEQAKIIKSEIEEKQTQPPKRFSPASIISNLEKKNLGTKATRANILETLYDRGYIKDKAVKATSFGISLIDALEKHSPIIIDEKLTRNLEEKMQGILDSKNPSLLKTKQESILAKAKQTITEIAEQFEKNENEIGKGLLKAELQQREEQKIENKLCVCPICKKGNLAITYSRKTRRNFVACDAYPDCKTTYSLPPRGTIKKTNKICEKCGFPILMSLTYRRKPWFFCFNTSCETNKKRLEEYNEKKKLEGEKVRNSFYFSEAPHNISKNFL